jgi:hypothetical protein
MPDFQARDFLIVQGGGRRNNCFIATDDNEAISENNRFKSGKLLFYRSSHINTIEKGKGNEFTRKRY